MHTLEKGETEAIVIWEFLQFILISHTREGVGVGVEAIEYSFRYAVFAHNPHRGGEIVFKINKLQLTVNRKWNV